jgi:hypothetical protein
MTMDREQEKLLDELRSLVNRVDPVPEEVTAFADAALGWRRIDAELAELLADSADSPVPAGVRGDRTRSVTFRSSDLEIDVDIQTTDGGAIILGQLAPAVRASINVQRDDGTTAASAEADALGRFRVELPERGRIRLQVIRDSEPAVETSWLSI